MMLGDTSPRRNDPSTIVISPVEETNASKVIYFSNLPRPYEITETVLRDELINFGRRFGPVQKVLLLASKYSGLLQFSDIDDAMSCVQHVKENNCFLCHRKMKAEFSNKKEIISNRNSKVEQRPLTRTFDRPHETLHLDRRPKRPFHTTHHLPLAQEDPWSSHEETVMLNSSDLLSLPPGSRIVNMPVRIDADGTMTPLPPRSLRRQVDSYPRVRKRERSRSPVRQHYTVAPTYAHGPQPAVTVKTSSDPTLLTCFNLPKSFTVEETASFFGVYGDILRVKKSSRNDRQCWLQLRTPEGASNILRYLNNITIFGRELSIEYSNVSRLRMGQDAEKDKNFGTTHHRYQTRDAEFFRKHLCSPTNVLFGSNIPATMSEEDLCSKVSAERAEFLRDALRPSVKSGFLHFSNVDGASRALITHHGTRLHHENSSERNTLIVSFSQRRRPGPAVK